MKPHKSRWTLGCLVDLEFFLQDRPLTPEQSARWYADYVRNTTGTRTDSLDLLQWVEHCREIRSDSPGRWLTGVGRFIYGVVLLVLFFSGIGAARTVLQFDGILPINLFVAFGFLVVIPFLFSAVAVLVLIGSVIFSESPGTAWGKNARRRILLNGVVPLIQRIHQGPDWIRSIRRWVETLWSRSGLYAKATGWTGFTGLQACGLVFGMGLYIGTVFRGAVEDLNFGWSTTSQQVTTERVEAVARGVAFPWLWTSADWAVPSFEDVVGSRYVKRQGVRDLDTRALQAWFPFLSAGILVYGVFPRLLLLLLGLVGGRLAFRRLEFQDADCQALLRQIKGTAIRISGSSAEGIQEEARVAPAKIHRDARILTLIHDEVAGHISVDQIQQELSRHVGEVVGGAVIELDAEADEEVLRKKLAVPPDATVVLVVEGWRPCLEQTKDYIRLLRKKLGKEKLMIIALAGKTAENQSLTPLSPDLVDSWKESVSDLRDPYVDIISINPGHESK